MPTDRETFARAYEASLMNVERYLEDMKELIGEGSFGHSLALGIIGEEELSKALLYFLISEGILKPTKKLLRYHIRYHPLKIAISKVFGLVKVLSLEFDQKQAAELVKRVASSRQSEQERLKNALEGAIELGQAFVAEHTETDEVERDAFDRQRLKERGLYVDIVRNEVVSPLRVSQEEAEAELRRLEEYYRTIPDVTEPALRLSTRERMIIKAALDQLVRCGLK